MALAVGNTDSVLLTTTTNPVISTTAPEQLVFLKVTVCNTDVASRQVTVYRVQNGASPAASNALVDALAVAAGQTLALQLSGQTLVNGEGLYAKADAANVVNLNIGYATL